MEDTIRQLQERITHLQRHIEQQDRAFLELSLEVSKLATRLARAESKVQQIGESEPGPPADERPPHW